MCDPVKGVIPPCEFIDLATELGLLKELTLGMLDFILADVNAWNSLDLFPSVSLNISVTLLEDPTFANHIIRSVKNANISPTKILLEITESALMKDPAVALGTIGRLKLNGFGFSIDDYGIGFSSMQQLSYIAFSELKIDRSFVNRMTESEHLCNIVQSALDMGQRLSLTTVAEGVETKEELQILRDMGCHEIQGHLFSSAMPACDVLPWLHDNKLRIASLCRGLP
ncbi:MAG: EAL domain-containing protein [Moraxellaceae bacterium]|nr:MAG: EAL domain-containing protein [Moraxellaceae bacterium]